MRNISLPMKTILLLAAAGCCSATPQRTASFSNVTTTSQKRNLQEGGFDCSFLGAFVPGNYVCQCNLGGEGGIQGIFDDLLGEIGGEGGELDFNAILQGILSDPVVLGQLLSIPEILAQLTSGEFNADTLGVLLPFLLPVFQELFPGLETFDIDVGFNCVSTSAICLPLCITPSLMGSYSLLSNKISVSLCNEGFDNSGGLRGPAFTLPPFCAKIGGRPSERESIFAILSENPDILLGLLGGLGGGDLFPGATADGVVANAIRSDEVAEDCTFTVRGEQCASCEICDDGEGYRFDCTNVDKKMKQSECVHMSALDLTHEMSFDIHLDDN